MKRIVAAAALAFSLSIGSAAIAADAAGSDTRTGWIACNACSHGRAGKGDKASAPNRECSQKCIREGSPAMFYDEATDTLLKVSNPEATKGQESHRVALTGTFDTAAKTVRVSSVKVLEEYVAKCSVPPKE